ncbi:MAG TPA: EthD domain-containing protein [Myxococcota bacterium]|nr:EthD domain-containing protein [Myxococcota bacterium]
MMKMIFGAKRRPGMSREDFGRYWTTVHAEKAKRVPGIVRYVINLAPDLAGTEPDLPYDGIAEVWFENEEDMRASARSPEVAAVLDDEKNLFDLATRFTVVVKEHVMIG